MRQSTHEYNSILNERKDRSELSKITLVSKFLTKYFVSELL